MSRSLLLIFCVVIGLVVIACGDGRDTNKNAPANTSSAPATTAATGDSIGVAECDGFLKSYEDCVGTKVPEAARASFRTTMATWRTEWKKLAENPQTRAGLANACKMQIEAARANMKAYNCTF